MRFFGTRDVDFFGPRRHKVLLCGGRGRQGSCQLVSRDMMCTHTCLVHQCFKQEDQHHQTPPPTSPSPPPTAPTPPKTNNHQPPQPHTTTTSTTITSINTKTTNNQHHQPINQTTYLFTYPPFKPTNLQSCKLTNRPTDRPTDRQTDSQTDRPTNQTNLTKPNRDVITHAPERQPDNKTTKQQQQQQQQQQQYNLVRLRFIRRGASTPLWGVEACSHPSRRPNPIPAIPPYVVRTPHLHGAPITEETVKL